MCLCCRGKGGPACPPLSQHLFPASFHRSTCCITASATHRSCKCEPACAPRPLSGCLSFLLHPPHSEFQPLTPSWHLSLSLSLSLILCHFLCPLFLFWGLNPCFHVSLNHWFSRKRGNLASQGTLRSVHNISGCHSCMGGRPGLLLNTLQCTGQHPRAERSGPTGQECQPLPYTHVLAPIQISQLTIGAQSHTSVGLAFDHEPHHPSVNLNEYAFAHLVLWAGRAGIFWGPSQTSGQPSLLTPCPSPAAGRGQEKAALEAAGSEDLGGGPP